MSAKRTSVDAVFGTEKLPQAGKQNHLGNRSEPLEPIEAKAEIQEQERGGSPRGRRSSSTPPICRFPWKSIAPSS